MASALRVDHLIHLATDVGIHEHALLAQPRAEHGSCTDDMARALVLTSREPDPAPDVRRLTDLGLSFLLAAQHDDGLSHNRRNPDGSWGDDATSDDHWGRSLWALGAAAASLQDPVAAAEAHEGAVRALRARSSWPRATAYAVLGAEQLLRRDPRETAAWRLLSDAPAVLGGAPRDPAWPWPEPRLTYANAVLPEAMIVLGSRLERPPLLEAGLERLAWLADLQTLDGHLSVVPATGLGPGEARARHDQQPIEVACLAEAARTASQVTGDERWSDLLAMCRGWFDGDNDEGLVMHDPETGGGYDGLERGSVNLNQGAESTLAWLSTVQLVHLARAESASAAS